MFPSIAIIRHLAEARDKLAHGADPALAFAIYYSIPGGCFAGGLAERQGP